MQRNNFFTGLLRIFVEDYLPFASLDRVLHLIDVHQLIENTPLSYRTIIRRFLQDLLRYDYCFECPTCKQIHISPKKNDFVICQCEQEIDVKIHLESNVFACCFSLKDQIVNLSEFCSDLAGVPSDKNEVFYLDLILAIDEAPVSVSSRVGILPVLLFIDNISLRKRMHQFFLIKSICLKMKRSQQALSDELDSHYNVILEPLVIELIELLNGFRTNWSNDTKVNLKLFLGDAPLRATVLLFKNYSSKWPCHRCLLERSFKRDPHTNQTSNFPLPLSSKLELRNVSQTLQDANSNKHGVKGICPLYRVNKFDFVNDTLIEFMHSAELGYMKNFLENIKSDSGAPYYLDPTRKKAVESRLKQIALPSYFSRGARSLDCMSDFKAFEYKAILFYTFFFMFNGILPSDYVSHHLLISNALFKLYKLDGTDQEVDQAREEIDLFLSMFDKLNYSKGFFKYNVHILIHIYEDRKKHGPIFLYNAYGYESILHVLGKCVQSPNITVEEICNRLALIQSLRHSEVEEQCSISVTNNSVTERDEAIIREIKQFGSDETIRYFKQAIYKGKKFRSDNSDCYVKLKTNAFVKVIHFLVIFLKV